jgi:serine/threonine protein kinase
VKAVDVRETLARLANRPPAEWNARLEKAFPDDPSLRRQALLWLHAEHQGAPEDGEPPSLGPSKDQRYELAVRLDSGATASVWQAFDRKLGRTVAIKVFHDQGESEALDQVIAEAQAASDVISDYVVRVLDVHDDDAHPYIVMELVGEHDPERGQIALGNSAASCIPRSVDEVARWVMHVARGVHDAHLRNVFHRDLKPQNVLITPITRRGRVADFGLAVSGTSEHVAHPVMTLLKGGPGGMLSVRGTPEYMAPEQARGLPLTLDPRAAEDRAVLVSVDVWGLGAIAYDLLAGRPPWLARTKDDLGPWEIAASGERPPRLERTARGEYIPRRLRRIVEKAMALDPHARYATAAAVANELEAYLARRPTSLDSSRALRIVLWGRRNPQLALTAFVAVILMLAVLGTYTSVRRLRTERDALTREVTEQVGEQDRLNASVVQTRAALAGTQKKLATERENLASLQRSIDEDRQAYEALLAAKEEALRTATSATRRVLEQLAAARRDRQAADQARATYEKLSAQTKREAERFAKERDKCRTNRDVARDERDTLQREVDALESKLEAALDQVKTAQEEVARLRAD